MSVLLCLDVSFVLGKLNLVFFKQPVWVQQPKQRQRIAGGGPQACGPCGVEGLIFQMRGGPGGTRGCWPLGLNLRALPPTLKVP